MKPILEKQKRQERRAKSLRRHIRQTASRPRLSVNRSSKHIFAQVIDDDSGRTLAAVGTSGKRLAGDLQGKTKTERAAFVGKEIARLAQEAGVKEVVFDRGHRKYHGRVKALADAAREGGLKF
jgi:large subunit ribosomal protein L18